MICSIIDNENKIIYNGELEHCFIYYKNIFNNDYRDLIKIHDGFSIFNCFVLSKQETIRIIKRNKNYNIYSLIDCPKFEIFSHGIYVNKMIIYLGDNEDLSIKDIDKNNYFYHKKVNANNNVKKVIFEFKDNHSLYYDKNKEKVECPKLGLKGIYSNSDKEILIDLVKDNINDTIIDIMKLYKEIYLTELSEGDIDLILISKNKFGYRVLYDCITIKFNDNKLKEIWVYFKNKSEFNDNDSASNNLTVEEFLRCFKLYDSNNKEINLEEIMPLFNMLGTYLEMDINKNIKLIYYGTHIVTINFNI